jgi:hypothetical protein
LIDLQLIVPDENAYDILSLDDDKDFDVREKYKKGGITLFRIITTEDYYLLLKLKYGDKNVWIR